MATISGILINGAGQPLPNVQIVLTALKTSSKVLNQSKALITTTSETGAYSINAQVGNYAVTILRNGYPVEKVGCIKVYVDSQDGTLNDYLLNPNESEISPEILAQIVDERKLAQKSASDAKNSANEAVETLENSVKKTGEESQTVEGVLNATTLQENGQRVYSPNNKPTAGDVGALSTNGGTLSDNLEIKNNLPRLTLTYNSFSSSIGIGGDNSTIWQNIGSNGTLATKLRWRPSADNWNFESSSVTINGTAVLKVGDGGVATTALKVLPDFKSLSNNSGTYIAYGSKVPNLATPNAPSGTSNSKLTVTVRCDGTVSHYEVIENTAGNPKKWVGECYTSSGSLVIYWTEVVTTANSTVDSNGFYKKASPIIRLFSNDDVDTVDGFEKSGCGLINSEAKGVTANKIAIGHYEIHGSLGFAKEGWYITLPEDANGNKKLFAEYSTDENNVITIKTYTKKFDFEKCEVVAGEPQEITDGRWIDIRLEMPIIEIVEQIEPIPSTLNPIMS